MFSFADTRRRRRPSLTPMIDVVFLLLVFFMLAARFGLDSALPLTMAGSTSSYGGPPRLVDVAPESLALNGVTIDLEALQTELARLTDGPDDAIILRPRDGAELQRLVTVMEELSAAGFARLILVE